MPSSSTSRVRITINTLSQLLSRCISSSSTFAITVLLARFLGANGFGDFAKISTYVTFFYLFADFGINAAYLRLKKDDDRFQLGHVIALRIILSFFLVFLSISLLAFLPQGVTQGYTSLVRIGIILYSLTIIAHAIITTTNVVFQETLQYELATLAVFAGSLTSFVLVAFILKSSVLGAVVALCVGSLVAAGTALFLLRRKNISLFPLFSYSHLATLTKAALPLGITMVFNLVYFRIDSVILTLTQDTASVGVYNLAYKIFEFPIAIPLFFMNALYPLLLKKNTANQHALQGLTKKAGIILSLSSLVATITLWTTSPFLSLLHPSFTPSVPVLRILSLGLPFFFLSSLSMWILVTWKANRVLLFIYGTSMIGNVIANSIFIPQFGVLAAAWITVIGEGCILLLTGGYVLRKFSSTRQDWPLPRIL